MVDAGTGISSIPFYLWTHSTTLAPLSYMASKEQDGGNLGTTFAILLAQVFFLLLLIGRLGYGGVWIPIVGLGIVFISSLLFASLGAAMTQKPKPIKYKVNNDDDDGDVDNYLEVVDECERALVSNESISYSFQTIKDELIQYLERNSADLKSQIQNGRLASACI